MSKVRILFLGTPDFAAAALARLIDDAHFEIVAVVSQPDRPAGRKMQLTPSPVKRLALEKGLRVLTPESVNTPEVLEQLRALGAESAAVVAFGQILSQKFLDLFPQGCVNVHGSLLPRWRGAAPIQRALMAGDAESGVCLQLVVRKLDAGAVLGSRRVVLDDAMDAVQLYQCLQNLGADLLQVEYMDYLRGNLTATEQDESLVTFAPKIEKAEARVQWTKTAREIFNHVRGLTMGPVAWTQRDGQILKLHKTRALGGGSPSNSNSNSNSNGVLPGTVVEVSAGSLVVACGQGRLELLEVQPESRAKMQIGEYLRGYPLKVGDRLQ